MERRIGLWNPWSLRELVSDIKAGRTTPTAAFNRSRDRITATETEVRAWVVLAPKPQLSDTGPLGGVPLGVKDIIDVAGYPTKCGSALRAGAEPAEEDASIVTAWRRAGAIPMGKTVTTEFAYFAPGPTRNPANPHHTPGGSSSGSAASVASGQVPLALGSQTAGSVTRPASYCGVASMVMSHDRFPSSGVYGLSPSMDSHGMFAATTSDLALAWAGLTGAEDVGHGHGPAPRLLLWTADLTGAVTTQMQSALAKTAQKLRASGATVDVVPLERLISKITEAHFVVMAYEAALERAEELAQAKYLSNQLAALLGTGASTSPAAYEAARRTIASGTQRMARAFADYDAVLGPGAQGVAPAGLAGTGDPLLSRCWQALGLPVVVVPGLRDEAGLPMGLQLVGRPRDELGALRAAVWVEQNLPSR